MLLSWQIPRRITLLNPILLPKNDSSDFGGVQVSNRAVFRSWSTRANRQQDLQYITMGHQQEIFTGCTALQIHQQAGHPVTDIIHGFHVFPASAAPFSPCLE